MRVTALNLSVSYYVLGLFEILSLLGSKPMVEIRLNISLWYWPRLVTTHAATVGREQATTITIPMTSFHFLLIATTIKAM